MRSELINALASVLSKSREKTTSLNQQQCMKREIGEKQWGLTRLGR